MIAGNKERIVDRIGHQIISCLILSDFVRISRILYNERG
jgi:hypothetical protein